MCFNNGLQRFILKENVPAYNIEKNDVLQRGQKSYFNDIEWAMTSGQPFKTKTNREHISLVMNSARVQSCIKVLVEDKARKLGRGPINFDKLQREIESEAMDICRVMMSDYKMPVIRCFGWVLTKLFK